MIFLKYYYYIPIFSNFSNEKLYINYLKEVESKNINFERKNLTSKIIKKRIEKIKSNKSHNKNYTHNISLNSPNIPYIVRRVYPLKEIVEYINSLSSFQVEEINLNSYPFCKNPKISIIIPIHNYQEYILNLHQSIQDQSLKDIEIIYVDDNSTDNSSYLLKNLQKKDKRIVILKNKENMGPFYSRNKGAIFARGEYIQFIDGDDLIVGNILEKAYFIAKNQNVDVIQYMFMQHKGKINYNINEKTKNGIIFQPELSDQMYYGKGHLVQDNYYIFNKIYKTKIFLDALIYIGDDILKEKLYFNEDLLQLFSVLRVANSLLFIDYIGYAKIERVDNKKSLLRNGLNPSYANKIYYDNFIELKFLFNKTLNNKRDKAICLDFLRVNQFLYSSVCGRITKGYEFFDEVFDLLLKSEYFNEGQKKGLERLRKKIMANRKYNY